MVNAVLANRIAELERQKSQLEHDLKLMTADRNRLIDEMAKRWPDSKRIDVIGQNGNTGEHYTPVRYMVGHAVFQTLDGAKDCSRVCLSAGTEYAIIPLYAGQPIEVKHGDD